MTAVMLLETERGAVNMCVSCVVAAARISVLMSLCVVVGGDLGISSIIVVGGGGDADNEDDIVLTCGVVTV